VSSRSSLRHCRAAQDLAQPRLDGRLLIGCAGAAAASGTAGADAAGEDVSRAPEAIVAASAASTLRRSSGSVLEARRLNHHIGSPRCRHRQREAVEGVDSTGPVVAPRPGRAPWRPPVGDRGVDLAGRGVPLVCRPSATGQRTVLLPERGEHVHRREHARVGEPEVAEVVVSRVLAAEDRCGSAISALMKECPTRVRTGTAPARRRSRARRRRDDVVDDPDVAGRARLRPPCRSRERRPAP
jgi:hypothetical protein